MKVGIVTLFDSNNLGNKLQNYALQEILKKYADDVVTLKNKPSPKTLKEKVMRTSPLAESVWVNNMCGKKRKASILKFANQYIKYSPKCYYYDKKYNNKPENCDYYCVGSDQIWNPNLGRVDGFNYLEFSPNSRNFSFAASFGISIIPEQYIEKIRSGISHVDNISVREDSGIEIIRAISNRNDVEILIDPTLYFDMKYWEKVMSKPREKLNKKYMLIYFLGKVSLRRITEIRRFACENNMEIIDIMDKDTKFYSSGPGEFLYLIYNAAFVCTDSFHASVFSFLFDIPLAIFDREGHESNMGGRLENLVNKFQLRQRMVVADSLDMNLLNVDYFAGKNKLECERRKVDMYLAKIFASTESIG